MARQRRQHRQAKTWRADCGQSQRQLPHLRGRLRLRDHHQQTTTSGRRFGPRQRVGQEHRRVRQQQAGDLALPPDPLRPRLPRCHHRSGRCGGGELGHTANRQQPNGLGMTLQRRSDRRPGGTWLQGVARRRRPQPPTLRGMGCGRRCGHKCFLVCSTGCSRLVQLHRALWVATDRQERPDQTRIVQGTVWSKAGKKKKRAERPQYPCHQDSGCLTAGGRRSYTEGQGGLVPGGASCPFLVAIFWPCWVLRLPLPLLLVQ